MYNQPIQVKVIESYLLWQLQFLFLLPNMDRFITILLLDNDLIFFNLGQQSKLKHKPLIYRLKLK